MNTFVISCIFFLLGILAKLYPLKLLAGFNTLSKTQKEKVDKQKLGNFMMVIFFIIATIILVGNFLLPRLFFIKHTGYVTIPLIFVVVIFAGIYIWRFWSRDMK